MSTKLALPLPFDFAALPEDVLEILERLRRKKIPFYLIGGFVRDWAGGCATHRDIDIGVQCNVYKLQGVAGGKIVRGRHAIVKTSGCDLVPIADLRQDLERRDFTVNAMAIDSSGRLIDPYGGVTDAMRHIFRMTRPDLFSEDPIRLARLCRLAARMEWKVDGRTGKAAMKIAEKVNRDELLARSGLRLGLEIIKSFDDPLPSRFFLLAHEYGVLRLLLPFLAKSFSSGVQEHWEAIVKPCDNAPVGDFGARMAALLKNMAPWHKHGRAARSADIAKNFLNEIQWNYVKKNIYPEKCRWFTEWISLAIRMQNFDFSKPDLNWDALTACAGASFTADQYFAIRGDAFGDPVDQEKIKEIRRNLLRKAMRRQTPRRIKSAALRFYGYNSAQIKAIISRQIIPAF